MSVRVPIFKVYDFCYNKDNAKRRIVVESIYTHAFLSLMRDTFKINKVHIIEIWAPWKNRLELYTLKTGINGKDAKVNLNKLDKLKEDVGLKDVLSHVDVRVRNNCCLQNIYYTNILVLHLYHR